VTVDDWVLKSAKAEGSRGAKLTFFIIFQPPRRKKNWQVNSGHNPTSWPPPAHRQAIHVGSGDTLGCGSGTAVLGNIISRHVSPSISYMSYNELFEWKSAFQPSSLVTCGSQSQPSPLQGAVFLKISPFLTAGLLYGIQIPISWGVIQAAPLARQCPHGGNASVKCITRE
jgi:hypothetical protein